nr:hypothetical protein [Thermoproteota archaeon]
ITLHRLRDFVKTTISNLGYQDFSEYFIGHSGSTYWNSSPEEILDIFHKVEPYLTFLDYSALDAKGADIQTKLAEKDQELQAMKVQFDKLRQDNLNAKKELDEIREIVLGRIEILEQKALEEKAKAE